MHPHRVAAAILALALTAQVANALPRCNGDLYPCRTADGRIIVSADTGAPGSNN